MREEELLRYGNSFYASRESAARYAEFFYVYNTKHEKISLFRKRDSVDVSIVGSRTLATAENNGNESEDEEAIKSNEEEYKCDNKYCRDFEKKFKYKSLKDKHDK